MPALGLVVVDEVRELRLALGVVTGNPDDVAAVAGRFGDKFHQFLSHPLGVGLVVAEDDGLGHGVRGLEIFPNTLSHELGAFRENEVPVVVLSVILSLLDDLAVLVRLPFLRCVAQCVHIRHDSDHLVGGEETVVDPLP